MSNNNLENLLKELNCEFYKVFFNNPNAKSVIAKFLTYGNDFVLIETTKEIKIIVNINDISLILPFN